MKYFGVIFQNQVGYQPKESAKNTKILKGGNVFVIQMIFILKIQIKLDETDGKAEMSAVLTY